MDKDQITLSRIKKLHPKVRDEAAEIYGRILAQGVGARFTDTLRSPGAQQNLYDQGRSKPGKVVTWAPPGLSFHQYGLAIDFCLLLNGGREVSWDTGADLDNDGVADWMEVVSIFEAEGWEWGGRWKRPDRPHFEKTFNHSVHLLKAMRQEGRVDENGYVLL